jgi:N-acetylglutamate synthase-like GNAT family acetyltransferase
MTLDIRVVGFGTPEHDAAVALRRAVLRTPLGLDFSPEDLAREAADTHFVAFLGGQLVGTVVMTPYEPGKVKLRQMAVADDMRGRNIGAQLVSAFEDHARNNGISEIILAARQTAQSFYARLGYATDDVVFTEVTIPHVRMWKTL